MSVQVTIALDSGCFLTNEAYEKYLFSEVGYFQSPDSAPEIRIYCNGDVTGPPTQFNLEKGNYSLNQIKSDGSDKQGITLSDSLLTTLLRMNDLNGRPIEVEADRFDAIIRFNAGNFCCSMVKKRAFYSMIRDPSSSNDRPTGAPTKILGPIAHNVLVQYVLGEGEKLTLVGPGGAVLWSTDDCPEPQTHINMEVIADNSTAVKFYRDALKLESGQVYYLPNQGDPPPSWSHKPPDGN